MNKRCCIVFSILAGVTAASVLVGLNWLVVGRYYAAGTSKDDMFLIRLGFLFVGALMPDTIAASVTSGIIVGLFGPREGAMRPEVRAGIAAVLFGVVATGAALAMENHGPLLPAGRSSLGGILLSCVLFVLSTLILSLFSLFVSLPFGLTPAVVGASIAGKSLRNRRLWQVALLVACVTVTLGITVVHGLLVRNELSRLRPAVIALSGDIERDMLPLPEAITLRVELDNSFYPKPRRVGTALPHGKISVYFDKSGRPESTDVVLTAPKGTKLTTRQDATKFLANYKINSIALKKLSPAGSPGSWESRNGQAKLWLREYEPPMD